MSKKILDMVPSIKDEIIQEVLSGLSIDELKKALSEKQENPDDKDVDADIKAWSKEGMQKQKSS